MIGKFLFNATVVCAVAYVSAGCPKSADAQTTLRPPVVAPTNNAQGIQLNWSQSPGATGYQVLKSLDGGAYTQVASLSPFQTTFLVPGNPPPVSLKLKVRALGAFGAFADSQPVYITDPRILAMLDTIAYAEGTAGLVNQYGKVVNGKVVSSPYYPYLVGQTNVYAPNLTRHPACLVQVTPTIQSTAAGRYQFLLSTWNGLSLADFTPNSQDIGGIKLMQRRNMITPLLQGQFRQAIYNGAPEWASLPTASGLSYYGAQPTKTITQLETAYAQSLSQRSK
jgi:muramidase (phage lysozyme)